MSQGINYLAHFFVCGLRQNHKTASNVTSIKISISPLLARIKSHVTIFPRFQLRKI